MSEVEKLKNEIEAYKNKDVIVLGTDEAFALRDKEGEIRAFKQNVRLSESEGTLVQPVYGGPFVVSAQGFEVLAEAAGACVIFPQTVLVGNDQKPNPYAERDPDNRRILAVHARAIAFRFSSKGIPQVSDWTTIFDTPSYRMIDLLAKAKKCPQAFKLLPADMKPKQSEKDTWAAYPFDESTQLWVNTSHNEALTWFSQIINREKKAMDFAQTFAKRNAVKHLLGIQSVPGQSKGHSINTWDVPILCWRPTSDNIIKWDATQYAQLQDRVGNMITGNSEEFKDKPQIELQKGKELVSEDKDADVIVQTTDPEDQTEEQEPINVTPEKTETKKKPGPKKKAVKKVKLTEEEQKSVDNLNQIKEMFPEQFEAACKDLKIENDTTNLDDMAAIDKKMNEIMDGQ